MRTTRILRSKRKYNSRKRNPFKLIALVFALFIAVFACTATTALAGGLTGAVGVFRYLTSDLPDFTELEKLDTEEGDAFETTKIYAWGEDKDGDGGKDLVLIYEIIDPFGGDRQWVPLRQIPQHIVDATVSIEDKTFWTNSGFDIEGIGRAFYEFVLKGGSVQGGSSITQQVVKNNLIEQERRVVGDEVDIDDYRRKVEEIVLSSRISTVYTKEQIMEWYLNSNFYGNLAYGIEAAARVYYDKTAVELNIAESAMLAAIPQSPAFNPIDNFEPAKARQELVLYAMFREGYIDRETFVAAREFDVTPKASLEERFDIISPHFATYVRTELERKFGRDRVVRGGLTVYTSLDLEMQEQAECTARAQVAQLGGQTENLLPADELERCEALQYLAPRPPWAKQGDLNADNASVIMIDPRTGEIKAMVGSLNYYDEAINGKFNVAVDGLRQPGSSFKPFTYLTALMQGYTPSTMMLDVETDYGTPYNGIAYVPQNYDRKFNGPMRMRIALANSYNTTAVEAMSWVGVDTVIRTAHNLGITTLENPADYGLPLTLGGGEVKLLDMAYAFSVFANEGLMVGEIVPEERQRLGYRTLDPVSILRVEDRNGRVLYDYNQPQGRRIISKQLAFLMNDMMSDQTARCAAFGCPNALELPDNRQVAAKTGTTNQYKDSWTVGYTPQMVVGVWIGNTDNTSMDEVPGSVGAAPLWNAIMQWAHQEQPKLEWLPPQGVVQREVCDLNGMLPSQLCPKVLEYFAEGTEPTLIDNMYQKFRINRATGRLATAATPPEQIEERVFVVYPDRALDWARETKKQLPPNQFDDIAVNPAAAGNAVIAQPQPFSFVRGVVNIEGNARSQEFAYYTLQLFPTSNPNNVRTLVWNNTNQRTNSALGGWDTRFAPDGAYTLLLQIFNEDGVVVEEARSGVTVDNTRPTANIAFPFEGAQLFVEDEFVVIQAQAIDDLAIERVNFFVDGAGVPFAISTVPPFTEKWNIPGPGCHNFRVEVIDGSGNSAFSEPVNVCFIERG